MKNQDIISNLNLISEKIFKILEKEIYTILDNILNISSDILSKEPLNTLFPKEELNGIILIANSLILFYVLYYIFTQVISIYNGKKIENIYQFLLRVIIIGILVNQSHFICETILTIFDAISSAINIFCKEFIDKEITFSVLKENIYKIQGIEKSDFISIEGLIKSMISIGAISTLITMAIRYVTILLLIIVSPIAILAMCHHSTKEIFKTWLKIFIKNLSIQIFVKLIILIPITYNDTKDYLYKVILLGSLYLLYKINSIINVIFEKI